MQMQVPKGRVAYEPSSLDPASPRETARGFRSFAERPGEGGKGRRRPESFADHYSQARQFFRSQTAIEQAHIASAFVFELSKVDTPHVREAIVGHLRHVDADLAKRVADGLGLGKLPPAPRAAVAVQDVDPSPALGLIGKSAPTLRGRCVGLLIGEGSNVAQIDALRAGVEAAGARLKLVAPKREVTLSDGRRIVADGALSGTPSVLFDAVAMVLPTAVAERLAADAAAIDFVRDAFGHLKAIAHCDGSKILLERAGVAPDDGVVGIKAVKAFVKAAATRQWAREPKVRPLA
jgi:catalase